VTAAAERARQRKDKAARQVELQAAGEAAAHAEQARAQEVAVATAAARASQRAEQAGRQAELQAAGEAAVRAEEARVQEAAQAASRRSNQRLGPDAREAAASAPPAPPAPPPATAPAVRDAEAGAEAAIAAEARTDAYASPEPAALPPPASLSADVLEADDLPPAEAAAVGEDERLAAPEWLQRIRERRARGEIGKARASLERFIVTHPTTPIPEDLRSLAP
jgi:hypothetical protein